MAGLMAAAGVVAMLGLRPGRQQELSEANKRGAGRGARGRSRFTIQSGKGAGIESFSGAVKLLDFEEPGALAADELLIDVKAAGVGNWDEMAPAATIGPGAQPPRTGAGPAF